MQTKCRFYCLLGLLFLVSFTLKANLTSLISANQWAELFPNRAGTQNNHPQGFNTDFYSYNNLQQAITEMSDFKVEIKIKQGVWGQLTTVTKKSNNQSYIYSDVTSFWHSNSSPVITIEVDLADFMGRGNETNNKRELAAFLAQISKETTGGWEYPIGGGSFGDYGKWGLYFVHELNYNKNSSAGAYSTPHADFPPNPTKGYYGRGPIQLSWNYNYGQLSKFLYNDKNILINNPERLEEDGVLAFKSAIWFWMMPQWPIPSCHQIMHELWEALPGEYTQNKMYQKGFAHTTNIINGAIECRQNSSSANVVLRSELYKYYLKIVGFTPQEIALENTTEYSTTCRDNNLNFMQSYVSAYIVNADIIELNNIAIYPNPAKNLLNLKNLPLESIVKISNVHGQIILQELVDMQNNSLNISALQPGFYCLTIHLKNQQKSFKFKKID